MGRMGQGSNSASSQTDFLSDSFKNHEWNFPGLRKNVASATNENANSIEQEIKSADQDGIKEIVLLQQRTVLQVSTYCNSANKGLSRLVTPPLRNRAITHLLFVS